MIPLRRTPGDRARPTLILATVAQCSLLVTSGCTDDGAGRDPALPWLAVADGKVVERDTGEPVRLRGVNMDQYVGATAYLPSPVAVPDTYATEEDYEELSAVGATLARLGFEAEWLLDLDSHDALRPEGVALLDRNVEWAARHGMYTVLDLHFIEGGFAPCGSGLWDQTDLRSTFVQLWARLAEHFADEPAVLGYDLFNEPAPYDALADDPTGPWWSLVDETVAAVRAVDADHVVVVENPLSGDYAFRPVSDPNVLYSFHSYDPYLVTHAGVSWSGDFEIPNEYRYPGEVPTWIGEVDDEGAGRSVEIDDTGGEWVEVETESIVPPAGTELVGIVLFVSGQGGGTVDVDDVDLVDDQGGCGAWNPSFEEASGDGDRPRYWFPDDDCVPRSQWSSEAALTGEHGMRLSASGAELTVRAHDGVVPAALCTVEDGRSYRASAWLRIEGDVEAAGVGIEAVYVDRPYYDRAALEEILWIDYISFAAEHGVAVYAGELGCNGATGPDSQYQLVRDVTNILNELDVPWTLWTYRELDFGLAPDDFDHFALVRGPHDAPLTDLYRHDPLWRAFTEALAE